MAKKSYVEQHREFEARVAAHWAEVARRTEAETAATIAWANDICGDDTLAIAAAKAQARRYIAAAEAKPGQRTRRISEARTLYRVNVTFARGEGGGTDE